MQDLDLHVVELVDACLGPPHILGQRIVHSVGGSIAVVDQQGEVGGLAEVGDAAGIFDGGAGELGLHELHVGAIVGGLLGGVGGRDGGGGGAVGRVVDGGLISRLLGGGGGAGGGRAVVLAEFAGGVNLRVWRGVRGDIPLRVLGLDRGRLLALRGGDAALDGEGGAVGAGHTEARGVAAHLATSAFGAPGRGCTWAVRAARRATHLAGVACCVSR